MSEPIREPVTIDGPHPLSGYLIRPAKPAAVAVLNGATAVPHTYYRPFAGWLAREHGLATLTYDYRDFGASARGPIRASKALMSDWGVHDQQAARDWLRNRFPDRPLWVIGHSLGGFMLPFQRDLAGIDRVLIIASGPVHVTDHPWPYQALARMLWFGHGPLLAHLLGYLPGRFSGLNQNLPRDVFLQWRRWCTSPNFLHGDIGTHLPDPDWTGLTAPVRLIAAKDDATIPPKCVWRLEEFYKAAPRTTHLLDPATTGNAIGHLAAFARRNSAIWPELVA